MLRRMSLTNFKCWREFDVDLAPITIFFGTNSSGKTAILQSLLMLKQTVASRDPNHHLNFGGGPRDYVDLGSYRDLVLEHEETRPIGMRLAWDTHAYSVFKRRTRGLHQSLSPGPSIGLEYEVAWRWDNDVFVDHLGYSVCGDENFDCFIRLDRLEPDSYRVDHSDSLQTMYASIAVDEQSLTENYNPGTVPDSPSNCYLLPLNIRLGDIKDGHRNYEPQFARAFDNLTGKIRYLGPLRKSPERFYLWTGERKTEFAEPDGADAIHALISSSVTDGKLLQQVRDQLVNLQLVNGFAVPPIGQPSRMFEVNVTINGSSSALVDVGFGVSQVLPVVTLLLSAPQGSIILLEQPELHLHPNAQAALADLMLYAAEERGLQLIVESHSEHILRRLQRRIAEAEAEFATPENISMYFCRPSENGSTAEEIAIDRFGQISNWPEKFMGDVSGDLHTMLKAALKRRSKELERDGTRA